MAHALAVLAMRLVEKLTLRRELHIQPRVVVAVGLLAALFVSALWLAGADRGAMKILLVSILFPLIAFLAYVSDREGGEILARRGAMVGGLSLPLWSAWVICKSSFERRGVPYPNTLGEFFLISLFSILLLSFGACVGMMTGVVAGRVMRAIGWFGSFALGHPRKPTGKAEQEGVKGGLLDGTAI
jgi:hypothetical protein